MVTAKASAVTGPTPGWLISSTAGIGLSGLSDGFVQLFDLGLDYLQQLQQVLAPLLCPPLQWKVLQQCSTLFIP